MYTHLHVKYPILLPDFHETSIFSTDVWEILKYPISWKATQWEPGCSMQTNGQTQIDMMTLTPAFLNFANMPKKELRIGDLDIMSLWIIDYNNRRWVYIITTGSTDTRQKEWTCSEYIKWYILILAACNRWVLISY